MRAVSDSDESASELEDHITGESEKESSEGDLLFLHVQHPIATNVTVSLKDAKIHWSLGPPHQRVRFTSEFTLHQELQGMHAHEMSIYKAHLTYYSYYLLM